MDKEIFLSAPARLKRYAFEHKIISAVAAVVLFSGIWWVYAHATSTNAETTYTLGSVERGTIVSTVSGSGQVSASSQVDLKPAAAGDLVSLSVKTGQVVKKGALIAATDPGDSAFELESARLSYQKLTTVDPQDLSNAQDAVVSAYADARAALAKASSDLSGSADDVGALFSKGGYFSSDSYNALSSSEKVYVKKSQTSYFTAKNSLDDFSTKARSITISSDHAAIKNALAQAYETALLVAQAAKDAKDAVAFAREHDSSGTTAGDDVYTAINTTLTTANSAVGNIASAQTSVKSADDALITLQEGPDTLDMRNDQLSISQKAQAYQDHFLRAPFDGVVASVAVKVGDTVGSGDTVATLITKEQVAEISLNEIDAAKVKVGNKATLTFDAVEELTLTGTVAEMDLVGTVSQGVVSYNVKIALDTQDERIRPGMTVNASIITDTRQDVLVVPSSAVKTQNGIGYVQMFVPELSSTTSATVTSKTPPQQVPVETGISDDTNVEITSGLREGQQIVTRTNAPGATAASSASATTRRSTFGGAAAGAPVFIGR